MLRQHFRHDRHRGADLDHRTGRENHQPVQFETDRQRAGGNLVQSAGRDIVSRTGLNKFVRQRVHLRSGRRSELLICHGGDLLFQNGQELAGFGMCSAESAMTVQSGPLGGFRSINAAVVALQCGALRGVLGSGHGLFGVVKFCL
jgi:hypothetical protein